MRRKRSGGPEIRGIMLDPARLTERHEFYFDLLPRLAAWGYNTLWWHFCDDEGFALRLDGHPELASPYALTKSQTRRLVAAARRVGIDVVPEVESLGHALFITRLPKYAHLLNGNPYGHNALCPSHPDTIELVGELIREVAEVFDGPYLHAGLDEAEIGNCPRCARRAAGKPPGWLFARHALAVHEIVRSVGRRMILWADPVEKNPALLKALPRDILLAHWHYGEVPREKILPSVRAGFEIVCVPALGGTMLQPGAAALKNVDDMVALARDLPARSCRGVVACWWESARNLRDTYPLAAAYTGAAIRRLRGLDKPAFTRRFARDHFGLDEPRACRALWELHELAGGRSELKWLLHDSLVDLHRALALAAGPDFAPRAERTARCLAALRAGRARVRRNRREFDAYVLSASILDLACSNGRKLLEALRLYARATDRCEFKMPARHVAGVLDEVAGVLERMQGPIDRVARAAAKEWDRTRYPGDAKKDGASPLVRQRGPRAIVASLLRCGRFHRRLTADFRRAVARYRRGPGLVAGATASGFPGGL